MGGVSESTSEDVVGTQDRLPQKVSQWHIHYVELKLLGKQPVQGHPLLSPKGRNCVSLINGVLPALRNKKTFLSPEIGIFKLFFSKLYAPRGT